MSVERPFDLVLFDLDGTLIDSASQLALAVNRTLTDLGLPEVDEAVVRTWVGNGADKLIQRALDYREAPELFAKARLLFDQHYQACLLQGLAMYDGVEQSLRRLQCMHQCLDVRCIAIDVERCARRGAHTKPAHERLRAVMPGADRDALFVQYGADVVRMHPFHREGDDASCIFGAIERD